MRDFKICVPGVLGGLDEVVVVVQVVCAHTHACEQEFEHIQRKAFGIPCAPECNICCMVAMSANKTTESPERLSPEGPGESLLRQRMRKSQIKSVLCNEHIKVGV